MFVVQRLGAFTLVVVLGLASAGMAQTQPPTPPPPGQPQPSQPPPTPPPPGQPPGEQPPAPQQPGQPEQAPPSQPEPQAVPAPPPTKIFPGVGIAGVLVGGSARALQARLGTPSQVFPRGELAAQHYYRFGLIVYVRGNTIVAVATTNSLFRIGESLRVGHPAADARAAFGAPSGQAPVAGFQGDIYDDRGVGFGIERGTIAAIIVFRPGEARLLATL